MKRPVFLLLFLMSFTVRPVGACTNFPINIGVIDNVMGRLLVESIAVLVNERSGVTVGVHYFDTPEEMDAAVMKGNLEMIIADTSGTLKMLKLPADRNPDNNFKTVKELYKDKKMIWLKPFAFRTRDSDGLDNITAPVISRKSLAQFPALPRLINKLSRIVDTATIQRLVKEVDGRGKARRVAKDFLMEVNLI